jgi:hypothetical protein
MGVALQRNAPSLPSDRRMVNSSSTTTSPRVMARTMGSSAIAYARPSA